MSKNGKTGPGTPSTIMGLHNPWGVPLSPHGQKPEGVPILQPRPVPGMEMAVGGVQGFQQMFDVSLRDHWLWPAGALPPPPSRVRVPTIIG